MDSDDLYDEFGNFIGDANDSDAESVEELQNGHVSVEPEEPAPAQPEAQRQVQLLLAPTHDIFAEAETVYVDPTDLGAEEPVIKVSQESKLYLEYTHSATLPETAYSKEYLIELQKSAPHRVRNMAFVGRLHSGKTSLLDMLVQATHPEILPSRRDNRDFKPMRYTDTHKLEKERGITINNSTVTLLVQDYRSRSHVASIVDCPGHPDFADETHAALDVVDGAVLVVDTLEGFTALDKQLLTEILRRNLPFVVVLNKFDRLVLEARLLPRDFVLKIKHVLAEINAHVHHNEYVAAYTHSRVVSPRHNVVFASHLLRTSFTLATWSRLYAESSMKEVDEARIEQGLWGDVFLHDGRFTKTRPQADAKTTFEQLVVEPMYKIITHALVAEPGSSALPDILAGFGVSQPKAFYKQDSQMLLPQVFQAVLGGTEDLVSILAHALPAPQITDKPAQVYKLFPSESTHTSFTRVYHGTLRAGDRVKIGLSGRLETIASISLPVGRYNIPVDEAQPGTMVVLTGLDSVENGASLYLPDEPVVETARHASGQKSFFKVAVECENEKDLPKLVDGLKKLTKTYLSAKIHLEESGEYSLLTPGELYLDCFLHDLRHVHQDYLSINVSDPMVQFAESCGEGSATKIASQNPAKTSSLSIIAEPVADKRLLQAIEKGRISMLQPKKTTAKILNEQHGWDALAARSLWAFGPDSLSASLLLDDVLDSDKSQLEAARGPIVAGFNMGVGEGPLVGEAIRRTKFKILDATLSGNIQTSSSQLIPMARNAVHIGLLTAEPKLLEPMYKVHVMCTYRSISAVHTMLERRRGWAVLENAISATQLFEIEGYVPIIDATGLDTDMRLNTQGQAFCSMSFVRWDVVPGDPLDQEAPLPNLKPVPRQSLARDFVTKTRKRKGLSGEPNLQKYIDPQLYAQLKQSGIVG